MILRVESEITQKETCSNVTSSSTFLVLCVDPESFPGPSVEMWRPNFL